MKSRFKTILFSLTLIVMTGSLLSSCHVVYSFKDASIPNYIKTVKIGYIQNTASYVNPQVAQKLYDKIQQKVIGSTKLTRTNDDAADYVINGIIRTYDPTQTVGVSGQQASTNRLTVTVHMTLKDNKTPNDEGSKEFDVSRSFDYAATLSLQQAEGQLLDEIVRTLTDDIFNQIFSNW